MKYFVEQKLWSLKDRFNIFDEEGNAVYTVEGELWTFAKKFHLYDKYDQEVAYIEQVLWTWLPKFKIFVEGDYVGMIVKEFTWFTNKYHLEQSDWQVDGDFMAHDYIITSGYDTVATIEKKWWTFADKYCIDIDEQYNPVIAIAIVLAIDAVLASQAAAASSSSN